MENQQDPHHTYMQAAREEAIAAYERDEVPIGAVIVDPARGEIIARAGNRTIEYADPSAHAEILAIRAACTHAGAQRIPGYDMYVTLEPCTMCAGAISFARIRNLYFGAPDLKGGAITSGVRFFDQPTCHHRPAVINGIMETECGELLRTFFKDKRQAGRSA